MEFAFEDWMVALSALIIGVGLGWLFWGGRSKAEPRLPAGESPQPAPLIQIGPPAETDSAPAPLNEGPVRTEDAPDGGKLEAIELELKDVRELIEEGDEEVRLLGEEVAALDGAIKRANGRLRLLIREIRRRTLGAGRSDEDGDA